MDPEKIIYECTPSPIVNLKSFVLAALFGIATIVATILTNTPLLLVALVLPLGFAWWHWLKVKSTKLTLTDQRLIVREGIFTKHTNETELYRVRDTTIEEPFFFRLFGVGNIIIFTTDDADNRLNFHAYNKPHWLKDQIRNNAEICRKNRRWGNDSVLIHDLPV